MGNERALNMLNTALDMEKKGFEFYKNAVETCVAEAAREVFETLMKDEVLHMKRIKTIFEGLQGGGPWTEEWKVFKVDHGDLSDMFRDIAKRHGPDIHADTSDLAAVDVGVDFEGKAVEFYKEQLGLATPGLEAAFIEAMIVEERSHHAALTDMKLYLTDPAAWFADAEKSTLEGG